MAIEGTPPRDDARKLRSSTSQGSDVSADPSKEDETDTTVIKQPPKPTSTRTKQRALDQKQAGIEATIQNISGTQVLLEQTLGDIRADLSSINNLGDPNLAPIKTSTALNSPGGASMGQEYGSHDNAGFFRTPMGGGVNHNLEQYVPIGNPPLLPNTPSREHTSSIIANLLMRINFFRMSATNRPGWIGTLEANLQRFHDEVQETIMKCRSMNFTDTLCQAEQVMATLTEISLAMRTAAGISADSQVLTARHQPSSPSSPLIPLEQAQESQPSTAPETIRGNLQPSLNNTVDPETGEVIKTSGPSFRTYRNKLMLLEDDWNTSKKEINDELAETCGRLREVEARELQNNIDMESFSRRLISLEENFTAEKNLLRNEILKSNERFKTMETMIESTVTALQKSSDLSSSIQSKLSHLSKYARDSARDAANETQLLKNNMIDAQAGFSLNPSRPISTHTTALTGVTQLPVSTAQPDRRPAAPPSPSLGNQQGTSSDDDDDPLIGLDDLNLALKSDAQDLKKRIDPRDIDKLPRHTVTQLSKNILPGIENDRKTLQSRLDTYSTCKETRVAASVFKYTSGTLREARTWCSDLRERYSKLGCDKKPLEKKIHENLEKFTRESELNVFEFLRRFEQLVDEQGTEENKAELLYENYLSNDLKDEILLHKRSFEHMKNWLIHQCGDVKDITRNIIQPITKAMLPSETSTVYEATSYYRKLYAGIQKIQELKETKEMPQGELEDYIHSNEFLLKLTGMLPARSQAAYMDKLVIRGLNPFK